MATNYQNMKNADLITVIERIECERDIMADAWHDAKAERDDLKKDLTLARNVAKAEAERLVVLIDEARADAEGWRRDYNEAIEAVGALTDERDQMEAERDTWHDTADELKRECDKAENMRAFWRRQYYIETGDAFDE